MRHLGKVNLIIQIGLIEEVLSRKNFTMWKADDALVRTVVKLGSTKGFFAQDGPAGKESLYEGWSEEDKRKSCFWAYLKQK